MDFITAYQVLKFKYVLAKVRPVLQKITDWIWVIFGLQLFFKELFVWFSSAWKSVQLDSALSRKGAQHDSGQSWSRKRCPCSALSRKALSLAQCWLVQQQAWLKAVPLGIPRCLSTVPDSVESLKNTNIFAIMQKFQKIFFCLKMIELCKKFKLDNLMTLYL